MKSKPQRPLCNRVTPFGEIAADPARGLFMGNRGGRMHDPGTKTLLGSKRWASRQWICCVTQFKNRHHPVMGQTYTALFFLDEVTALAAGHRPCFECRRGDATKFAQFWATGRGGRERARAAEMDIVLHRERLDSGNKRLHILPAHDLPAGCMVAMDGQAWAFDGRQLLRWTFAGYAERIPLAKNDATVLTPPSVVDVLRAGYTPVWHASAL